MNNNHWQRRTFLKQLSIGSLATISLPALASHADVPALLPDFYDDEAYWELVKRQFAVPEDMIMMNAANLCPSPYSVYQKVVEYAGGLNRDVSFQFRSTFDEKRKESISMLAEMVGADSDELGITRNTSEANSLVVQGIDLKSGDEVVLWDQNHPSNSDTWMNRGKRIGFKVRKISVPASPKSKQEFIDPFLNAITPLTRLLAFSHISNLSGMALPVKEICEAANTRGILTLVDGAQSFGMMQLDLHDIGCSFYTASTHKWLMGPMENGLLYVRRELIPRVWPNIIGGGWKESKTVDANVCVLGQRNDPTTAAIPDILSFHSAIGVRNIEARVQWLNSYLKTQLAERLPVAEFVTPHSPELSGGIVIFNVPGKEAHELSQKLYDEYHIASAPTGGLRLSPHVYNTKADIDRVVECVKRAS